MANIFPAFVVANPSYVMPELLLQYSQPSGYTNLLAGNDPMARLGTVDQYVYMKKLSLRTRVAAGQVAYNSLPSVTVVAEQISTPTYLMRVRAEYDHHDTAAGGVWGVSVPEAQRLGMRQGIFQQLRNAGLFGYNPTLGEGLLNTAGATTVTLPADSNGNTTVLTYDNGQMAVFLLAQINAAKQRMFQLGMPARVSILGPQRVLGTFEYQNIVQLTQFQREGAGSASTAGTVKSVLDWNGDTLEWSYDDTLIGKGAGGTDAVIISIPEIKKPENGERVNTNVFADVTPGYEGCNIQLVDMVAPREIPTPLPGGAIDVLAEMRSTSGWGVRPEATTIVSMQYQ